MEKMLGVAVIIAAMLLSASQTLACIGALASLEVQFGGETIDLFSTNVARGNILPGGIHVESVAADVPIGSESSATIIVLRQGLEVKRFRVAMPPVTRGLGCNQPYLTAE